MGLLRTLPFFNVFHSTKKGCWPTCKIQCNVQFSGAADNTKRWLGRVLADYLDSNQPSSSSSAAELTRSDVNELIVNFYLALLTTSPTEQLGIGPYPETIKIDEPKIGALGEKFLQLELTVAAIFIASNLVGKAICEGGQFKAELKRDLIAILNDVDWK